MLASIAYDETNDILRCKISEVNGYSANYFISDGVFLNVDKNHLPASIHINHASEVLDVSKSILEDPNVFVLIKCTDNELDFELFVANERIYASKSMNRFDIPQVDYEIQLN